VSSILNRPPKKPETFRPPASLLNEPKGQGAKVFWIIATVVLAAAVTYEFLQSLNRFNALTRDDVPNSLKPAPAPRANLTPRYSCSLPPASK